MSDEEMWEAVLALWKRLSEMEDCEADVCTTSFKNNILNELGYDSMEFGCPFCDEYHGTEDCPIGDCDVLDGVPCYDTPYDTWERKFRNGEHSQVAAKEFYEYLIKLKAERSSASI